MSTKIWTAYRAQDQHFWYLVKGIAQDGKHGVQREMRKLYYQMMATVDLQSDKFKEHLVSVRKNSPELAEPDAIRLARLFCCQWLLLTLFKKGGESELRTSTDPEVFVQFWRFGDHVYLIPHADGVLHKSLDFLKDFPHLEEYHYQNQTDKPSNISDYEWDKREEIWHTILEDKHYYGNVRLDICTSGLMAHLEPAWKIADELRKPKHNEWIIKEIDKEQQKFDEEQAKKVPSEEE